MPNPMVPPAPSTATVCKLMFMAYPASASGITSGCLWKP
jgi:hypothetical protein